MDNAVTLLPHPDSPTTPQDLAASHGVGHPVDHPYDVGGGEEMGLKIFDLENRASWL
jgi:hypothetical protein